MKLPVTRCLLAGFVAFAVAGCASKKDAGKQVQPGDFAGTPRANGTAPTPAPPVVESTPSVNLGAGTPAVPPADDDSRPPEQPTESDARAVEKVLASLPKPAIIATTQPTSQPAVSYTLDGMVGQVNGHAIYAATVFEPISEQLAALGAREPRPVFRRRARELIGSRLGEMLTNALFLGEAERDLSAQEQYGLQNFLKEKREGFLRQFGMGSETMANTTLMEKRNKTLDQLMTETRNKALIERYLGKTLFPKINVTRKDIERYYNDHPEEFNPPAGRTIRVIRVSADTPMPASRIEKALASESTFEEVARSKDNAYSAKAGRIEDDGSLIKPLNDALAKLKPGEHSPRIELAGFYWWVYLESVNEGKSRSLRDAQRDIEFRLKSLRYNALLDRYRQRLLLEGRYNPVEQMADSLTEIAMARYAIPE